MARPGRPYWKGFLRLSLVSIPVEIHNAIDSGAAIQFNQIHKPTGKRVNYTKTVKGVGAIEATDIVKGYEIDRDQYVIVTPEEIESVKVESKRTLDLQQFVDVAQIDPRYFERPYYVLPADDEATEGYLVIREALAAKGKMGVGQITMSGREYLVTVSAVGKGLVMEVLRYANEIKPEQAYFGDLPELKLDREMVALAGELIARKASDFQPERYRDTYYEALRAMIDEKAKGRRITAKPEAALPESNVIDLMAALKSSLKGTAGAAKPEAKSKQEPKKTARKSGRV